jgi:hypothetical protein
MLDNNPVVELHHLARKVELMGYPSIAKSIRYDADRLAEAMEKTKINKIKEQGNGQHSRFN